MAAVSVLMKVSPRRIYWDYSNIRSHTARRVVQGLYRGTSLIRKRLPIGPYTRTMPRNIWWP